MKHKKGICLVAVMVTVSLLLFACAPKPAPPEAPAPPKPPVVIDLLMGSTSTTSGYYPGAVALAKILNENVPGIRVTVVETGATHDNLMRVRKGHLHFATVTCPEGTVMAYYGTHRWKGEPWDKYRILNHYTIINQSYTVRADSGIKSIRELEGKKFHFGIPGSATEYNAGIIFEALKIKPERVLGSLADAVAMTKDGRVVGFVKSTPIKVLDAAIADVRSLTPVRILSFTEEEIKKALETIPGLIRVDIPAGAIAGAPEQGAITTYAMGLGNFVTSDMSEELVYKMIKAIIEKWAEYCAVQKEAADYDPIKVTIEWTAAFATPVPLHAGVVKYFTEKGFDVPAKLIPPEYKK